jgi:hypothetical protein
MKTIIYTIFFMICAILLFSECEDVKPSNLNDNNTNKAIGTFTSDSVDKEKWGDFELVLEMKKSSYRLDDAINIELYFSNIGDKTIILPPINPNRQIESPPIINIWSDNIKIVIDKLVDTIYYNSDLIIEPNGRLILINIDLNKYNGIFWERQNNWDMEEGNIGEQISPGTYYASAFFGSVVQIYSSITDTLSFQIRQ